MLSLSEPILILTVAEVTTDSGDGAGLLKELQTNLDVQDPRQVTRGTARGFVGWVKAGEPGHATRVLALTEGKAGALIRVDYHPRVEALVAGVLDSVSLNAAAELDPLALHGIKLSDRAGFEVSNEQSMPITFVEPGKSARPAAPFELRVVPIADGDDASLEALGDSLLEEAKASANVRELKKESRTLAGQPALAITYLSEQDGKPIGSYLVMIRLPGSLLLGSAKSVLPDYYDYLPRFERVMQAIQLDASIYSL
jgi:hypothetical protein